MVIMASLPFARRCVCSLVMVPSILVVSSCGDDASAPDYWNDTGGSAGTGGAAGTAGSGGIAGGTGGATGGAGGATGGAGGATGGTGGATGGTGGATGGTGGGSTGQPCDAACTGSSMCDAAGDCVCAPGWELSGGACVASAVSDPAARAKAEVCDRYQASLSAGVTEWIPGTGGGCDPGTVPFEGQVAALRWLNFYRWMLGVGPVQVDPSVAQAEQECAQILNYEFGHSPDPSVQCYTAEGAAACGASLIAQGYGLVGQVNGYAMETEQNLVHRRNVLAVGRAGVWFGASGNSSDMHYGGAYSALPTDPALVAHPGPGLNVRSAVPSRWFVQKGTQGTPPLSARVTVIGTGEDKPMLDYHHYADFNSFDLDGWTPEVDVPYLVELVEDGGAVFAQFETTFVNCP